MDIDQPIKQPIMADKLFELEDQKKEQEQE